MLLHGKEEAPYLVREHLVLVEKAANSSREGRKRIFLRPGSSIKAAGDNQSATSCLKAKI